MELNNEKVYQSFLNTTKKLIDIYKNSNIDNRKILTLYEKFLIGIKTKGLTLMFLRLPQ